MRRQKGATGTALKQTQELAGVFGTTVGPPDTAERDGGAAAPADASLTHVDAAGKLAMVSVGAKDTTLVRSEACPERSRA